MLKQYADLKYNIEKESINNQRATVKVKITVYDLYKSQVQADNYRSSNLEKFSNNDGTYDAEKFLNYKLKKMKEQTDTVDFYLIIHLTSTNDKWTVKQLSNSDLEKIHGVYNYEMND